MNSRWGPVTNEPKSCSAGFSFVTGSVFEEHRQRIPNCPGVYVVFFRDYHPILFDSGYRVSDYGAPWTIGPFAHHYTGETWGLRDRLNSHLFGTIRDSNLRKTILAIQASCGALGGAPNLSEGLAASECWLSHSLVQHSLIGFKECDYVLDVEAELLRGTPSPLNVKGRSSHPYAQELKRMTAALQAHPLVTTYLKDGPHHHHRRYRR